MKARVGSYEPYRVNEVGGGYYSFHLFANPNPIEVEQEGKIVTEHEVDLYRTSISKFDSAEAAVQFVEKNWQLLVDECKKQEEAVLAASVRSKRDKLLVQADIAVNKAVDSSDTEAETKARVYRQALRDIPDQEGFPYEVDWPTLGGA
ncbi:MAG: tail fiber assembly protein [Sphaerochaetaceae bacterium]